MPSTIGVMLVKSTAIWQYLAAGTVGSHRCIGMRQTARIEQISSHQTEENLKTLVYIRPRSRYQPGLRLM